MYSLIYLLNIYHLIIWQAYDTMLHAVPTFKVCLRVDFGKGFIEEANLHFILEDEEREFQEGGIVCEAPTWCSTEACESMVQVGSTKVLIGWKCWV